MINANKKVAIAYLLDYDGSAGEINEDKSSNHGFKTMHAANPKLNARIEADAATDHVTQVSIQLTSLRNSGYVNRINKKMNKNGCAFTEVVAYKNELDTIPNAHKLKLRKMLVQDYQQGKPPGTTWDAVLSNSHHPNLYDSISIGDLSKLIIIFTHMWHAYFEHQNDIGSPAPTLIFKICDDSIETLDAISDFYKQNPNLIPPDSTIQFIQYDHFVDNETGVEDCYIDEQLHSLEVSNTNTTPVEPFNMAIAIKRLEALFNLDINTGIIRVSKLPEFLTIDDLIKPFQKPDPLGYHEGDIVVDEPAHDTDPLVFNLELQEEDEKPSSSCCQPLLNLFKKIIWGDEGTKKVSPMRKIN
jgi:hypothetical protein